MFVIDMMKYAARGFWEALPFPEKTTQLQKAIIVGGLSIGLVTGVKYTAHAFSNRTRPNKIVSEEPLGKIIPFPDYSSSNHIDPLKSYALFIYNKENRELTNKLVILPTENGKIIPSKGQWTPKSLKDVERFYENAESNSGRMANIKIRKLEDELESTPISVSVDDIKY